MRQLRENWVIITSFLFVYSVIVAGIYNYLYWSRFGIDFFAYVESLLDIYRNALFPVITLGTLFSFAALSVTFMPRTKKTQKIPSRFRRQYRREQIKIASLRFSVLALIIILIPIITLPVWRINLALRGLLALTVIIILISYAYVQLALKRFIRRSTYSLGFTGLIAAWLMAATVTSDLNATLKLRHPLVINKLILSDSSADLSIYHNFIGEIGGRLFVADDSFKKVSIMRKENIVLMNMEMKQLPVLGIEEMKN